MASAFLTFLLLKYQTRLSEYKQGFKLRASTIRRVTINKGAIMHINITVIGQLIARKLNLTLSHVSQVGKVIITEYEADISDIFRALAGPHVKIYWWDTKLGFHDIFKVELVQAGVGEEDTVLFRAEIKDPTCLENETPDIDGVDIFYASDVIKKAINQVVEEYDD